MYRIVILSIFIVSFSYADVWSCGEGIFTTGPIHGQSCKLVESSLACGSDGNKYVTPGRDSYQQIVEKNCKSEFSLSPFVNLALVDSYRENPPQARSEKKLRSSSRSSGGGFPSSVSSIPEAADLPPVAQGIIQKYLDIWSSYDEVLAE